MENKLKILTEQLYRDGVEKGHLESEQILTKARHEASLILSETQKKSEEILREAKKKADGLMQKADSEIKISLQQALGRFKGELTRLVSTNILRAPLSESMKNGEFLKKLILSVVDAWGKGHTESLDLKLVINDSLKPELEAFLASALKSQIEKGLVLVFDHDAGKGFKVGPKDGAFVIDFNDETLENFLKEYLRPMTRNILFGASR
jgi:V/A-type H+-transporting ATPase subunit E